MLNPGGLLSNGSAWVRGMTCSGLSANTGSITGSAGAETDDADFLDSFALHLERIQQGGGDDDCGTVLVIVKDWDVNQLLQFAFDEEAFRRLDVFQVDAAKGGAHQLDRVDEGICVFGIQFDID